METRNWGLILFTALLAAATPAFGQTQPDRILIFPQVADGPLGDGRIVTHLTIDNPNQGGTSVLLEFFNSNGSLMVLDVEIRGQRQRGSTFNISLTRWASALIRTLGLSTSQQVGWARAMSTTAVAGTLQYSTRDGQGHLISQAGWGISRPVRFFQIPAFRDADLGDTGIAWVNPGASAVQITAVLVNASGQEVQRRTLALPARGHQASFLREPAFFDRMPEGFVGSAYFCVSGQAEVAPVALLISRGGILSGLAVAQMGNCLF